MALKPITCSRDAVVCPPGRDLPSTGMLPGSFGFRGVTGVEQTLRDPGQAVCSSTQRRRASRGTRTARPTRITGRDPERRSS